MKTNMSGVTPIGVIEKMSGSNATLPLGYAICNGQEVSKATYPQLFSLLGNTYGAPINPANFKLPDLRGYFIRGLDNGRDLDIGRTLGTIQVDTFQAHSHGYIMRGAVNAGEPGGSHHTYSQFNVDNSDTSLSAGGTETRPKNLTIIYIIKL